LGLAIYVTKMPIPFMNKGQTAAPSEADSAEEQKNKDWDPNAPLYGKNPAKSCRQSRMAITKTGWHKSDTAC
jgi:hypothetical protein